MKGRWVAIALVVCVAAAFCGQALAKEEVRLTVDMGGTAPKRAVPVRSGVPVARGKLKSADNVRVLIGGKEVDAQARAIATWPDKSVKWVLLDFLANGGDEVTVELGDGVKRKKVNGAIKVQKGADAITLDTGVIKLTVRKGGTAFIDKLAFDRNGNGRYDADETIVKAAAAGERRHFLDFVHSPRDKEYGTMANYMPGSVKGRSAIQIESLVLEEEGPMRCVVLVCGKHRVAKLCERVAAQLKEPDTCGFTTRIHVYRGSGLVTAEAHFVYDGVPDDDFVKAWGVDIPLEKGMKFRTRIAGKDTVVEPSNAAPFVAMTQTSADSYKLWAADADRFGATIAASGRRSPGWVDVAAEKWGVSVGVRWFWKRWPTAIHYDSVSGKLSAMLYPPETHIMNVRRYARHEWGTGETGAPGNDLHVFAPFAAKGAASSKEIWLLFHKGAADLAETDKEFQAFENYALAKAEPEYYSKTRALGYYAPRRAGQHDAFEQKNAVHLQRLANGRKSARWYGIWDFGNFQSRFGSPGSASTHKHGRWENDWGRWAWAHNDGAGRIHRAMMLQFLRTAERVYFEEGEACVKVICDALMKETKEYPWGYSPWRKHPSHPGGPWWDIRGCVHRHGVQAWSCGYIGGRGGNPMGHRIYYFLTGNGRTADMLDIIAEAGLVRYGLCGRKRIVQRMGHSGGNTGFGPAMHAILVAWERTGDKQYLNAIKTMLEMDEFKPPKRKGQIRGMAFGDSFGLVQSIGEYADISGDQKAKDIVKMIGDAIKEKQATNSRFKRHYLYPAGYIPVITYAARQSKDSGLVALLKEMVDTLENKGIGSNDSAYMAFAIESLNVVGE